MKSVVNSNYYYRNYYHDFFRDCCFSRAIVDRFDKARDSLDVGSCFVVFFDALFAAKIKWIWISNCYVMIKKNEDI